MKSVIIWIIYTTILALLVGGVVYAHRVVSGVKQEVDMQHRILDRSPTDVLYAATIRSQFAAHASRLDTIRQYVIKQEQIVEAVSTIENEGVRHRVAVRVPTIQEEESEEATTSSDVLKNIRLDVVATGDPIQLMRFLHSIEHAPYLLHVRSWHLNTAATTTTPQEGEEQRDITTGRLELRVIISVTSDPLPL
jgi:hypothetical protein